MQLFILRHNVTSDKKQVSLFTITFTYVQVSKETSYLFTSLFYWIQVLLQRDCGVLVRPRGIIKRVIETGSYK